MNGVPRDHIHGGRHVERELSQYLETWVGLDEGHILQWTLAALQPPPPISLCHTETSLRLCIMFVLLAQIGSSANTILSSSLVAAGCMRY